jgi:plastocyanin
MRSICKVASVEREELRARVSVVICALLFTTLATLGIWRATAAETAAPVYVVTMENMKFSPPVLKVRVGERIEFKNTDLVPHTVTAKPARAFDSGAVKPGESWTFVAKSAGTFSYTCTFHPMMAGELRVENR